jgi:hypothetical protein
MLIISIIGVLLVFLIVIFSIQIYFLNKHTNALLTGLLSMIAILVGTYLWISNGVIIEYRSEKEIYTSNAIWFFTIGVINLLTGLIFVLISIFKFLFWYFRKWSLDKKLTILLIIVLQYN